MNSPTTLNSDELRLAAAQEPSPERYSNIASNEWSIKIASDRDECWKAAWCTQVQMPNNSVRAKLDSYGKLRSTNPRSLPAHLRRNIWDFSRGAQPSPKVEYIWIVAISDDLPTSYSSKDTHFFRLEKAYNPSRLHCAAHAHLRVFS